jgi:hypothetical protein
VQAITVLGDDVLQLALLEEGEEGHVGVRRFGCLLGSNVMKLFAAVIYECS